MFYKLSVSFYLLWNYSETLFSVFVDVEFFTILLQNTALLINY